MSFASPIDQVSNPLYFALRRFKLKQTDLSMIERIARVLETTSHFRFSDSSDLVNQETAEMFACYFKAHHALYNTQMSREAFEYATVNVYRTIGREVEKNNNKTDTRYDLILDGKTRLSLKTETKMSGPSKTCSISSFIRAGWMRFHKNHKELANVVIDKLCDHMQLFDRLLMLQCFFTEDGLPVYRLIEIPRTWLEMVRLMKPTDFVGESSWNSMSASVSVNGTRLFSIRIDGVCRKIGFHAIDVAGCIEHGQWIIKL